MADRNRKVFCVSTDKSWQTLVNGILGMLRPLTYISGFFREAQYVVPSAVRLRATCLVSQARISLTSLRNRTIDLECTQKKGVIQPRRGLFEQ